MVTQLKKWEDFKDYVQYCKMMLYRWDETKEGDKLTLQAGRFYWQGIVPLEKKAEMDDWLDGKVGSARMGSILQRARIRLLEQGGVR